MNVTREVLEELTESFVGKRGPKEVLLWVCLDRSPDDILRSTFDYELSPDEQARHGGLTGNVLRNDANLGEASRRTPANQSF